MRLATRFFVTLSSREVNVSLDKERKKYGTMLAANIKALLDELGIQNTLVSMGWNTVDFKVDTAVTDDLIVRIYRRLDVNYVHYDDVKKLLMVGVEIPPVLGQYAG
jgi:hypothetical protein